MRAITAITLLTLAVVAHGQELLVTSAGKHTPKDGTISLELSVPNKSHLTFLIEFLPDGSGEGPDDNNPYPVAAGSWAFCFVGKDELWFYDGEGTYIKWKVTRDGLVSTCGDPKLSDGAPKALKKWIESRRTRVRGERSLLQPRSFATPPAVRI